MLLDPRKVNLFNNLTPSVTNSYDIVLVLLSHGNAYNSNDVADVMIIGHMHSDD